MAKLETVARDDSLDDLGQDQSRAWELGEISETQGKNIQDYEFNIPWQYEEDGFTVTRTTAWTAPGCHEGCSVLVYAKDGKLDHVEGDPEHPHGGYGRLCPRCFAIADVMYHKDRIIYPMKRDRDKRGQADAWERCSWDEALDICYKEFKRIGDTYGGDTIHVWRGTGRDAGWQMGRLGYAMGSPNEYGCESGISCYLPRVSQMVMTVGGQMMGDYSQFWVKRLDAPEFEVPNCTILWGCNPLVSNPDFQMGHWLTDCMKAGTKLITVDPRIIWLASRSEIHLQLRPGTDAALAMAMDNVLLEEGLIDEDFVEKWVFGLDEFKEAIKEYTPERAAEICWLDAEDIRKAARLFAEKKPSNVFWGVAVDMQNSGVGAALAIQALWILTGNVDNPGGMVFTQMPYGVTQYMAGGWGIRDLPIEVQQARTGWKEYPMYRFGFTLSSPDVALEYAEAGKMKGLFIMTANTLAGPTQEVNRWEAVEPQVEFCAAADIFMTPTIQHFGDVFLPSACWPEKKGVRAWVYDVSTINPAVDPVGECKSDAEICRLLGQKFDNEHYWPWDSDEEIYDEILKPTGYTWQELRDHGSAYPNFIYYKHEKGMLRADGEPGFNTPTGKMELWSTLFEQFDLPAVAHFKEPKLSPVSSPELYEEYPIILMTGARSPVFFHTEHRQIESLRQFDKEPYVNIHPEYAAAHGITQGDWCWVENPNGKCRQRANLTEEVRPEFALGRHGWWFPEQDGNYPNLYGVKQSNINLLLENAPSVYGFGSDIKCTLCKIYKCKDGEF